MKETEMKKFKSIVTDSNGKLWLWKWVANADGTGWQAKLIPL